MGGRWTSKVACGLVSACWVWQAFALSPHTSTVSSSRGVRHTITQHPRVDWLLSLRASHAHYDARHNRLRLHGILDGVTRYMEVPRRQVNTLSLHTFATLWHQETSRFQHNPPNATLTYVDATTGQLHTVVTVLTNLEHSKAFKGMVSFVLKPVAGGKDLPHTMGHVQVTIDADA